MIHVFPVQGQSSFANDFGAGTHDGIDIFAAEGTPIVAVADGALRFAEDPRGGHAFYLRADDGVTYYGAHLSRYEGAAPRRAVAGEILGYVGHTGNAAGTSSHLHFEAHPAGAVGAVNPFAELAALAPDAVHGPMPAPGPRPSPEPGAVAQLAPARGPRSAPLLGFLFAFGAILGLSRLRRGA